MSRRRASSGRSRWSEPTGPPFAPVLAAGRRPRGALMHATCTDIPLPRDADHHPVASRAASLADRSVLVTGAHGFIGRHLVTHLVSAGAHVHAAVRRSLVRLAPVRPPGGDLARGRPDRRARHHPHRPRQRRRDRVPPRQPSRRAPSPRSGPADARQQRTGSGERHAAAHDLGDCRVVLAGSVEEPHESGEAPCSPYAAAKLAATSYAMLFREQWGLPVSVLRPAMVYGPDQPDENKLIPYAITTMLDGHAPRLSSGTRPVDWVYIDDVCQAFLAAATRDPAVGVVADIGSGAAVTIAETVSRLAALTGYAGPSSSAPSPTAPATPRGSPTSALPATCSAGVPRPPSTPAWHSPSRGTRRDAPSPPSAVARGRAGVGHGLPGHHAPVDPLAADGERGPPKGCRVSRRGVSLNSPRGIRPGIDPDVGGTRWTTDRHRSARTTSRRTRTTATTRPVAGRRCPGPQRPRPRRTA